MREKRIIIISLAMFLLVSLSVAVVFNYFVETTDTFIVNICLTLIGSVFVSLIIAIIGYYTDKRKIIKEYGDILLSILNNLCKYKYMSSYTLDTASNNLKVLSSLYELIVHSLGGKYYEYSPFFRHSNSNKYIYSSFDYLYSFISSIYKELKILENCQHCLSNGASQKAFKNINNKIYKIVSKYNVDGIEISQDINNIVYDDLNEYLNEYMQLINGKFKYKYKNMDAKKYK